MSVLPPTEQDWNTEWGVGPAAAGGAGGGSVGAGGGGWIYFIEASGADATNDGFYRLRADGSQLQKLPLVSVAPPRWPEQYVCSPEGNRIAYHYDDKVIKVQELFDPGSAVTLAPTPTPTYLLDWVGERILAQTASQALSFDPAGANVVQITANGSGWLPCCFSPDGSKVLLVKAGTGYATINANGTGQTTIATFTVETPGGGSWVGNKIYFSVTGAAQAVDFYSCDPDGGNRIKHFTKTAWWGMGGQQGLSPDGTRFCILMGTVRLATARWPDAGADMVLIGPGRFSGQYLLRTVWRPESPKPYQGSFPL